MAQIVCIAAGTYREGINAIGDVVDVLDDRVFLGPAYDTFEVIRVHGLGAAEVKARLDAMIPARKTEKDTLYWKHADDKWYELKVIPRYQANTTTLSSIDKTALASKLTTATQVRVIVDKCQMNIAAEPKNLETPEVAILG